MPFQACVYSAHSPDCRSLAVYRSRPTSPAARHVSHARACTHRSLLYRWQSSTGQSLQACGHEAALHRQEQPQILTSFWTALTTWHSHHSRALWQSNTFPAVLAALMLSATGPAEAGLLPRPPGVSSKAFGNIPESLDSAVQKVPEHLGELLRGKSVEDCARKCIGTCIRGGQGAPGLGPMSMRREIVVFKEGFRSRTYCLSECTQVCALMAKDKQ